MMMKFSPWLLVSGLAIGGLAVAAEPAAPQDAAPQSSSMKVGIDPTTGKRRVLTVEESSALDVKAQKSQTMRSSRATRGDGPRSFPATISDAMADSRTFQGGIVGFKPPADLMSKLQVTRDASGKVSLQHSDPSLDSAAPDINSIQELPSE